MKQRAFTAIEILIVLAILAILSVTFFGSFSKFHTAQTLKVSSEGIVALLNDARSRTLSSENSMQYGVHFQSDKAVFFVGTTYSSSASTNISFDLDSNSTISSISLQGGGSDVLFNRLYGDTGTYGTITLQLTSDSTKQKIITIAKTGIVSLN